MTFLFFDPLGLKSRIKVNEKFESEFDLIEVIYLIEEINF